MEFSLTLLLFIVVSTASVHGLRFDVNVAATRCLSEEIRSQVLVLAHYHIVSEDNSTQNKPMISLRVTSPYGNTLHSADSVQSGQFSFTTTESGNYMACFWLPSTVHSRTVSVELDWKIGVSAKDWETVARKEKIEGVEFELMKLLEEVESLHLNLVHLRERENEMREVSETTNARVAWFSIYSLLVCLAVAGWQIWHLKGYFEKKKLL